MFASMLGTIISVFVIIFIFVIIITATIASSINEFGSSEKSFSVKDNSVLHLEFDDPIVDRGLGENFSFDFGPFSAIGTMGLNDILDDIEKAKEDDRIKGIFISSDYIQAGFATITEIRNALLDFKTSGKWIISYSENYSQNAYYLSSVADEIYVYPQGGIDFRGLNTEIMFLKGTLNKLNIEAQVIRGKNNKFKSAVEPLIMDEMSQANRLQTEKFLGGIWQKTVSDVAESRGLDFSEVNEIADSYRIRTPEDAVTYKFATAVTYEDEVNDILKQKLEIEEDKDLHLVTLNEYHRSPSVKKKDKDIDDSGDDEKIKFSFQKDKIAIIYAIGAIESGEGDDETIGSLRIAKAIREARKDSTIKAIVLRVNSPGGSALASDVIWRETVLAKKEKPFVVSMGDVAASGGYYIACAADKIYAMPNTITGSIGVFGILPNMKGFFNDKLGITFDNVKTGKYADLGKVTEPLSDEEFEIIQNEVERIYEDFVSKVSEGRNLTAEAVDSIGQGRVWSGTDAKTIGLIDEFGGLEDAIKAAAELASLGDDYVIKNLPKREDPFEKLLKELSGQAHLYMAETQLGDNYKLLQQFQYVKDISEIKGIQARLPFYMNIE